MKPTLKILVTGGRDYGVVAHRPNEVEYDLRAVTLLENALDAYLEDRTPDELLIIHGAARGADTLAGEWAKKRKITCVACPAQWKEHGNSAGLIRNKEMLRVYKPHVVVAFPGGKGTAHMVSIAQAYGVRVSFPLDKDEKDIMKILEENPWLT